VINHKKAQFNLQSLGQNWLLCWKHKICFHRRKPQVHICLHCFFLPSWKCIAIQSTANSLPII